MTLKVWIPGHTGLLGRALTELLASDGFAGTAEVLTATRSELDLTDQAAVRAFVKKHHTQTSPIDTVFFAAGLVGGITANDRGKLDFLFQNTQMEANVIRTSFEAGIPRLVFPSSSCVYPKLATPPIAESALWSGPPEMTNEGTTVAKLFGVKLCQYITESDPARFRYQVVVPPTIYGPNDCFDPEKSHFLPAILRRFHDAKKTGAAQVEVWGTGKPIRELLYSSDAARIMTWVAWGGEKLPALLNIGSGESFTVLQMAAMVAQIVAYSGEIQPNPTKPDGAPDKRLDSGIFQQLWKKKTTTPLVTLEEGLEKTYAWAKSTGHLT